MKTNIAVSVSILVATIILFMPTSPRGQDARNSFWHLPHINTPSGLVPATKKKIIIAIVDDGMRTTHAELRNLVWQNPLEITDNAIDDDGNGSVDDVNGWDVSDNNNTVIPPPDRIKNFNHGTYLAGIVAQIASQAFGTRASETISIMPVKSLSDNAPNTAITHGYQGIDYAVRAGADIILCAWNADHISMGEKKILHRAKEKGVLVIASAGNFPDELDMFPAADDSVFAVAALDRDNRISSNFNYGGFVDLSAPGIDIVSASSASDTAFETQEGTSPAAAMVAGAAAILKALKPSSSNETIKACLKNSSTLLSIQDQEYSAKQGAGLLNISAAVACLDSSPIPSPDRTHPQGYLNISAAQPGSMTWTIEPEGNFKGLWFYRPEIHGKIAQAGIDFYTGTAERDKPFARFTLATMPEKFFIPGTKAVVTLQKDAGLVSTVDGLMEYRAEPINFRTRYCRDTVFLSEPSNFNDGSGSSRYSGSSDCKWLITAPEGKVIHFRFNEFDTEPRTDLLYFFNGEGTHEKIMAIFSGQNIPPELTTWENKVLVWFVTNGENQGQGWQGEFTFIDQDKAQYPTPKAEQ